MDVAKVITHTPKHTCMGVHAAILVWMYTNQRWHESKKECRDRHLPVLK